MIGPLKLLASCRIPQFKRSWKAPEIFSYAASGLFNCRHRKKQTMGFRAIRHCVSLGLSHGQGASTTLVVLLAGSYFRSSKPQLLLAESVGFFGSGCSSGYPFEPITQPTSDRQRFIFANPFSRRRESTETLAPSLSTPLFSAIPETYGS